MSKDWFTADRKGLRQIHERLVARRGFGIIGGELYQNVMDSNATQCDIKIHKVPEKPLIEMVVTDNGDGFHDLSHAWTMFVPSAKKDDPTKAGRFNIGEKIVLSFAKEATIHTTSGTVLFSENDGRVERPRRKREQGTMIHLLLTANQQHYEELVSYLRKIIVRPGLDLIVNGEQIFPRSPFDEFEAFLKTEIGSDLRPTVRKTNVQVYLPFDGEVPMLYELGIPVVETGDKWHYVVQQKVPLNTERDNVTPSYLRDLRVAVFNVMYPHTSMEDTTAAWVNEATSDENCNDAAVEDFRIKKYGKKSVTLDPNNPEANAEAVAHDYIVIPPRGLTPGQRNNMKRNGALKSSTQMFPTAGKGAYSTDPNAPPVRVISQNEWTQGMWCVYQWTQALGKLLLGKDIRVRLVDCSHFGNTGPWLACYGRGHTESQFDFNVFTLGQPWFESIRQETTDLILHEFGHEFESNHLSHKYHEALSRMGAKLAEAMLDNPIPYRNLYKGRSFTPLTPANS